MSKLLMAAILTLGLAGGAANAAVLSNNTGVGMPGQSQMLVAGTWAVANGPTARMVGPGNTVSGHGNSYLGNANSGHFEVPGAPTTASVSGGGS